MTAIVDCCNPTVDPFVWERYTSEHGTHCLRVKRAKTVPEVLDEIRAIVGEYPDGSEEYLAAMEAGPWPCEPGQRTVVYAVNGTSEGDYVHVDMTLGNERQCLILGKTFQGRDAAWAFARRLADLLGA